MTHNVGQKLPRNTLHPSAINAEQVNLQQRAIMCLVGEIALKTSLHDIKDRFWGTTSGCAEMAE